MKGIHLPIIDIYDNRGDQTFILQRYHSYEPSRVVLVRFRNCCLFYAQVEPDPRHIHDNDLFLRIPCGGASCECALYSGSRTGGQYVLQFERACMLGKKI